MPLLEVGLDQVLKVLDQLSPEDLAVVQERLEERKNRAANAPCAPDDVFALRFDDYIARSDDERETVQLRAYQEHQAWIDTELERRGAEWLLVCGGEVLDASASLKDYPSREKLMDIGARRGCVPFVFVREPLVEEAAWSSLEDDDVYPTVDLTLAAMGTARQDLSATGVSVVADFDTGSPGLFVDFDQMLARKVISVQPIDQAHFRPHLGRLYRFHVMPLLVGVNDETGACAIRHFSVLCVRDWAHSPMCRVNPQREALAGRNLLLEFPLRIELDGQTRTTRVLEVPDSDEGM
jgi:hypothetical protein